MNESYAPDPRYRSLVLNGTHCVGPPPWNGYLSKGSTVTHTTTSFRFVAQEDGYFEFDEDKSIDSVRLKQYSYVNKEIPQMSFFEKVFGSPNSDVKKTKIDAQTAQVLELETQKKRLEIERDQINLELANQRKRFDMTLEEERHKQKLAFDEKAAVFEREKKVWATEKQEILDRSSREKEEFETRLKKDHELKLTEAVTLAKLDSQQQVKQAELDRDRTLSELRTQQAEELAKVKADTAEEYYKKLTAAFTDIQTNGTQSTKFVQELALKMFDSVPRGGSFDVGVNVGTPALPAPKSEPVVNA